MSSLVVLDTLIETVAAARSAISEEVDALSNQRALGLPIRVADAIECWAAQVRCVEEAAELSGLVMLSSLCGEVAAHIAGLSVQDAGASEEKGYQIIDWAGHLIAWVESSGNQHCVENLLAPLSEDRRDWFRKQFDAAAAAEYTHDQAAAELEQEDAVCDGQTGTEPGIEAPDWPEDDACDSEPDDDPLQQMIGAARDELVERASMVSVDEQEGALLAGARACLCHELENISMAAELAGLAGLQALCTAVAGQLVDGAVVAGEDADPMQTIVQWAEWLDGLSAYLKGGFETVCRDVLLAPVPPEQQDRVYEQLTGLSAVPADMTGDPPQESRDPTPDWEAMLSEPDTDTGDWSAQGVLGILQNELAEIAPDISAALLDLASSQQNCDCESGAASQYLTLLERLRSVSESLGLGGLHDVCSFVERNIRALMARELSLRATAVTVVDAWPQQVLEYLNDPARQSVCIQIIDCLQEPAWPEPLTDSEARPLLEALSSEVSIDELELETETRATRARAEDIALDIPADINQELINAYFQESPAHAAKLSAHISDIVNNHDVPVNVAAAQRLAHTLKGSSNLINAAGVANITHHMEDILEYLGSADASLPAPLASLLQEAGDCVETMIDAMQGRDQPPQDGLGILQALLDWANRIDAGRSGEFHETGAGGEEIDAVPAVEADTVPDTAAEAPAAAGLTEEVLRVPTRTVDEVFRMIGETSISFGQIRAFLKRMMLHIEELRLQDSRVQQLRIELEDMMDVRSFAALQRRMRSAVGAERAFDALEMDHYDELYGVSHAFIESVSDFREMTLDFGNNLSVLDGLFLQQERLNKDLQREVMTTRLVPAATIAARLHRCVRQVGRATDKQVELEIAGSDILLDSETLNRLTDPVMHMLRNAVDHGIEDAGRRERAGKPPAGRVRLEFSQEGNNVLIHCCDDGGGLDYDAIQAGAVRQGLIAGHEQPDPQALARLILVPGFSTRETATQTSGRGVGMDVVNSAIQALKGTMEIADNEPSGCRITLRLPITLVTSHAVLVRCGEELSAVPTNFLSQILAPGMGRFERVGNESVYRLEKDFYPLKSLAVLIGADIPETPQQGDDKTVLLVRSDEGIVAVNVDQIVSSHDIVIKSAGRFVGTVRGISGVTILGDGSVVPVLDVPALLRQSSASGQAGDKPLERAGNAVAAANPKVLVVDDSLSVRKSLSQLAEDAGFEATTARDGVEAVEMLRDQKPALVLADMEMPRMTGLELTSHIRADAELSDLPVIMITSRTSTKHREQAERAGVDRYVTKPFSEDDLLETMHGMLNAVG